MYKMLFFLHKSEDEEIFRHFVDFTVRYLKEIIKNEVQIARVESNLLLEQKYSHFCEVSANTKDELDNFMNCKAGKELNKDLMEFHKNITVITVDYNQD
ncbi:hypothetical protein LJE86_14925 [bacterium BMS3Abin03]|jgi:hypothetical protein|nr:hypothetical protein [bacterium BMS3Abin03]MCG6959766.1 hypothetical protein [bacterium BMS3Abin03]